MSNKKKQLRKDKQLLSPKVSPMKPKRKWPRVPAVALLFVAVWLICWLIWGDVLYIAEQNSYLAFDATIMQNVLDLKWAPYYIIGRFLLLSYHYPVFGSLLMASILTGISCLLKYLLPKNNYIQVLAVLVPLAYVCFIAYRGFNLFYQREPGTIFAFPFSVLLVLSVVVILVRILSKHRFFELLSRRVNIAQCLSIIVVSMFIVGFSYMYRENMRVTAKLQRLMQEEEWNEMIDLALTCKQPDRSVCCYYAIALSQTDQLSNRLFEIKFQFPKAQLRNKEGRYDVGLEYFNYDGDFYAGLINSAYHDCMERSVLDGPSVMKFKRMFLCSLINSEFKLAEKYMHLIKKMPFESAFAEKYEAMITDHELILKDPSLVRVAECVPLQDSFEQQYNAPLFLGYNVELTSGRHIRALYHSLSACLYSKNIDHFMERMEPLAGQTLPRPFEDALIIHSLKEEVNSDLYKITPMAISSLKQFLSTLAPYRLDDKKVTADRFRENYYGYFPLYYYLENIPDENYIQNQREKGQVN